MRQVNNASRITKSLVTEKKTIIKKDILDYLSGKNVAYRSHGGVYVIGDSTKFLNSKQFEKLRGKINLIITSPPYPLNQKKSYGNLIGDQYLKWFVSLAPIFSQMLVTRAIF